MFQLIYIEKEIAAHPRVLDICARFRKATCVLIDRYGEVFNRKAQNFRLQKKAPALILAKKRQHFILEIPTEYGLGFKHHYYFSHLLNCPFDCRYCFLQGMYRSAHYVFFINHEDFMSEIEKLDHKETVFFTGYDCDSLAFETVTHFTEIFLPFIAKRSAYFEFRTKSLQVRPFLETAPLKNCIVAWTLTPEKLRAAYEHKTPSLEARLNAMESLQKKGWLLGIRLDPILNDSEAIQLYQTLIEQIFSRFSVDAIHSVTLGAFRVPKPLFKQMLALYPEEPLFAQNLLEKENRIEAKSQNLLSFCNQQLLNYIPDNKVFHCYA